MSDAATNSDRAPVESADQFAPRILLAMVDLCLVGLLFGAPYFMGGRHPLGALVVAALTAVAATAWTLRAAILPRQGWRRSPLQWFVVAAVGLVALQIVPLPADVLERLAPNLSKTLPAWTVDGDAALGLGEWSRISLAPTETRRGLAMIAAYGLILLVVVQRIESLADVARLISYVAYATVAMACFAVVQYLTSNGMFFWIYEHPFRHNRWFVQGTFSNANHFAHLLALGVGPLIWQTFRGLDAPQRDAWSQSGASRQSSRLSGALGLRLLALAVVFFAGMMSQSRGGILAMLVATAVVTALYYRSKLLGVRPAAILVSLALLVTASLWMHGMFRVGRQISQIASGSVDQLDSAGMRRAIYQATFEATADRPLFGAGAGSFGDLAPGYLPQHYSVEFTHAESSYLQSASDAGLIGLALAVGLVLLVGRWLWKAILSASTRKESALIGAVAASLATSAFHALFDFAGHLPAIAAITAILIACAFRLRQLTSNDDAETVVYPGRGRWIVATTAMALFGAWMVQVRIAPAQSSQHWDAYLRLATNQERFDPGSTEQQDAIDAMIDELEQTVAIDPDNGRAHARLASAYLRKFDQEQFAKIREQRANEMTVYHLRDAALEGGFDQAAKKLIAERDADQNGSLSADEARNDARLADQIRRGDRNRDGRLEFDELRQVQIVDWLAKAFGPHCRLLLPAYRHARLALALRPLQGEAYLALAKLYFFDRSTPGGKELCIEQALRLRPHDPDVLLDVGYEAQLLAAKARSDARMLGMLAQKQPAYQATFDQRSAAMQRYARLAVDCWKPSFAYGPSHQRRIVQLLGPNPAAVEALLAEFDPTADALKNISQYYEKSSQPQLRQLTDARLAVRAALEAQQAYGADAAARWFDAEAALSRLDRGDEALRAIEQAAQAAPEEYDVLRKAAKLFYGHGDFANSARLLKRCLQFRPNDEGMKKMYRTALAKQASGPRTAAQNVDDARR